MLNYSYKLYKNKKNKKLDVLINTGACIWNHCVKLGNRHYRLYKKSATKGKLQKHIAKLRKKNPYWSQLGSQAVQEIVERYYASLLSFFKKQRKRPPKLKRWRHFTSVVYKQSGYKIQGNKLTINKIGTFKFHQSRPYGKAQNIRIKRTTDGNYHLIICSREVIYTKQTYRKTDKAASIGLDFGLKHFLTTSQGERIESPLFYKQMHKQIKTKARALSKAQKGSNNRQRRRLELARLYQTLKDKRQDQQWKLSHDLCSKYSNIYIEDLNIAAMQKLWGRKIGDLCFSEFTTRLQHTATKYNTEIKKVGRYFASSKLCSNCQEKKEDLTLKDRTWTCRNCSAHHDRDVNAAINILREGTLSLQRKSKTRQLASFVCMEESRLL